MKVVLQMKVPNTLSFARDLALIPPQFFQESLPRITPSHACVVCIGVLGLMAYLLFS